MVRAAMHALVTAGLRKDADYEKDAGANDGSRTRDIQDHNLALYQLSYVRHTSRAAV